MESEIINLNNLKLYNIKNNIFKIENIKLRISLFLYDYKYAIINNRLDLLKNNDYLDINLIDTELLIQLEKSTNKKIKKFVYYKYFLNKGITIPDDWFDIYLQNISIIDEWEIYKLHSVINRQIVDRPENNNEKWIDCKFDLSFKLISSKKTKTENIFSLSKLLKSIKYVSSCCIDRVVDYTWLRCMESNSDLRFNINWWNNSVHPGLFSKHFTFITYPTKI